MSAFANCATFYYEGKGGGAQWTPDVAEGEEIPSFSRSTFNFAFKSFSERICGGLNLRTPFPKPSFVRSIEFSGEKVSLGDFIALGHSDVVGWFSLSSSRVARSSILTSKKGGWRL